MLVKVFFSKTDHLNNVPSNFSASPFVIQTLEPNARLLTYQPPLLTPVMVSCVPLNLKETSPGYGNIFQRKSMCFLKRGSTVHRWSRLLVEGGCCEIHGDLLVCSSISTPPSCHACGTGVVSSPQDNTKQDYSIHTR